MPSWSGFEKGCESESPSGSAYPFLWASEKGFEWASPSGSAYPFWSVSEKGCESECLSE